MVFNSQHHSLSGLGVASLFLKAVSNVLPRYWVLVHISTELLITFVFCYLFQKFSAEHLLRTDPVEDKEGFFIALFVRKSIARSLEQPIKTRKNNKVKSAKRNATMNHNKSVMPFPFTRLSKLLLHSHLRLQTYKKLNMSTWNTPKTIKYFSFAY